MALDVYVGSLTRYYAGDWENVSERTARERGTQFRIGRRVDCARVGRRGGGGCGSGGGGEDGGGAGGGEDRGQQARREESGETPTALADRSGFPVGHRVVEPGRRCRLGVGVAGGVDGRGLAVGCRRVDLCPVGVECLVHGPHLSAGT